MENKDVTSPRSSPLLTSSASAASAGFETFIDETLAFMLARDEANLSSLARKSRCICDRGGC